jgi:hypothetical protein
MFDHATRKEKRFFTPTQQAFKDVLYIITFFLRTKFEYCRRKLIVILLAVEITEDSVTGNFSIL